MKITVKGINKKEKTTGILDESGQWYNVWNFVKIDKKSVPNPLLAVLTKGNTVSVDITVSDDGKYHNITGLCYDDTHPEDKKATPQIPKPTEHTYTPIENKQTDWTARNRQTDRGMLISYAKDLALAGKIDWLQIPQVVETLFNCQYELKGKEEDIQF